jgi:hypothetical protein
VGLCERDCHYWQTKHGSDCLASATSFYSWGVFLLWRSACDGCLLVYDNQLSESFRSFVIIRDHLIGYPAVAVGPASRRPPAAILLSRTDCEISECHSDDLAIHFSKCLIQLQEVGTARFQLVLVRLMDSANRIISICRPHLFNVVAEQVRNNLPVSKLSWALNA